MEGLSQQANPAILPPGEAKEDWKIIRALSEKLGKPLPFNTLEQLQALLPQFDNAIFVPFNDSAHEIDAVPFGETIINYYMTDVISRHSVNMANAINEIVEGNRGVT